MASLFKAMFEKIDYIEVNGEPTYAGDLRRRPKKLANRLQARVTVLLIPCATVTLPLTIVGSEEQIGCVASITSILGAGLLGPMESCHCRQKPVGMFTPGMIIGKILRSPHAHARIARIDITDALAIPGVLTVITAKTLRWNSWGNRW